MKNMIFPLLMLLSLTSCEEVIQLELEPGEQRIVAEANLSLSDSACLLILTRSGDFYADNQFESIENANAALVRSDGVSFDLQHVGSGWYYAENLPVAPGQTWYAQFSLPDGSVTRSADVITPPAVALDTLLAEKTPSQGPGGGAGAADQYSLTLVWKDLIGQENFYRIKIFRNGAYQSDIYGLVDDRLGDGETIRRPIIRQTYEKGDTVRVQLLSVDRDYYNYFTDLANSSGRALSAPTPYNPKGNWAGDALGCFGAWQVSERTLIIE